MIEMRDDNFVLVNVIKKVMLLIGEVTLARA
jgi:hypothetical protein